jgi:hypothetical protein
MITIAKLEHYLHEAMENKKRGILVQERLAYPLILWKRHCAANGMHQWSVGIQRRRAHQHAKCPLYSP